MLFPLAAETFAAKGEEESTTVIYDEKTAGDVDLDGKISAGDARVLLRCSVGLDEVTDGIISAGDLDRDGTVSSDDARTVLRVSVGLDSIKCIFRGHSLKKVTVAATCTSKGYSENRCERCSYKEGEAFDIINPSGHRLVEKTTAASCTQDGIFTSVCSVCSFVSEKRTTAAAYGHKWGIWQLSGETKSRTCKTCGAVETAKNVKTIYLTFDDGPGAYTERLLGYLKEYNVKATFFVTNQFPQYTYVLKKIVDDGHGIAVHTKTHQWSIYSSKQSYLNDFNAMHRIILDETGVDTKIFRFPGGTNNTVSRSYSRGIMAAAASHMTEAGYIYFDWNVDCGDTLGYSASRIASYTLNQIKGRHTSIVLMHDIKYNTVEAIRTIIKYGLDNGYTFAVIDESTPRVQFWPVN